MRVFVLVFNAGTENEGIHTVLQGGRNKILMFESADDATRFALLLEAQDFPTPTVEQIDAEEIKGFCQDNDYAWEIVSQNGDLIVPPEINVEEPDWKPDTDPQGDTPAPNEAAASSELAEAELEKIRRKLEGLL